MYIVVFLIMRVVASIVILTIVVVGRITSNATVAMCNETGSDLYEYSIDPLFVFSLLTRLVSWELR